jgi:hypothetical protein
MRKYIIFFKMATTVKTKECKASCSETASPNIATFPTPLSSRATIHYCLKES